MIGIGFALTGTLRLDDRAEERAFVALLRGLCAQRGVPFDAVSAQQVAERFFPSDQLEHHAGPGARWSRQPRRTSASRCPSA
jgi:hypothetical protein